jgi:selT/selW/selH-like putative selenoprotein
LAVKIEQKFHIQPELIASSGGVFEVVVDDTLIYSKKATGVFPNEDKILNAIETL